MENTFLYHQVIQEEDRSTRVRTATPAGGGATGLMLG